MPSCLCPRTVLAAVTFDNGAVLLRCPSHEEQRWVVDGQEVSTTDALSVLRDAFIAARARRPAPGTRRDKVVRMPDTPVVDPYPQALQLAADDAAADLTALLHARGLPGSWAIA